MATTSAQIPLLLLLLLSLLLPSFPVLKSTDLRYARPQTIHGTHTHTHTHTQTHTHTHTKRCTPARKGRLDSAAAVPLSRLRLSAMIPFFLSFFLYAFLSFCVWGCGWTIGSIHRSGLLDGGTTYHHHHHNPHHHNPHHRLLFLRHILVPERPLKHYSLQISSSQVAFLCLSGHTSVPVCFQCAPLCASRERGAKKNQPKKRQPKSAIEKYTCIFSSSRSRLHMLCTI